MPYPRRVATCSRCGELGDAPEDGLPSGWSLATDPDRGVQRLCARCTRDNVRAIEGKLPEEWWE
jgi:hypothetical protein